MTKTIDFIKIGDYVSSLIKQKDKDLYDNVSTENGQDIPNPLISQTHSFRVFYNSGDYLEYKKNKYISAENTANDEILINIINDGGIQDPTIPVNTYLQMVHVVFYCQEKFRTDMQVLFFAIALDLKAKLDEIDGTAVQVSASDQPTFNEKQSLGVDVFDGYFDLNVIVYQGAHLSNSYVLKLDNIEIPFTEIDMGRGYETTPDLQKRDQLLYFQNTSSLSFSVKALYVQNDEALKIFNDLAANQNFSTKYNVALYASGSQTSMFAMDMFAQDIRFHWAFGSIVSWQATFVPAISV
jgi:hypothetical protein